VTRPVNLFQFFPLSGAFSVGLRRTSEELANQSTRLSCPVHRTPRGTADAPVRPYPCSSSTLHMIFTVTLQASPPFCTVWLVSIFSDDLL